jgi:hypothetical protein
VTISGYTALDGKVPVVSIAITAPPGGTQQTLMPTEDKNDDFSTTFAKTDRVGKYTVNATSPSVRGTQTADFTVLDYSGAVDLFIAHFFSQRRRLFVARNLRSGRAHSIVFPTLPPKREALNKLSAVREDCAKLLLDKPVELEVKDGAIRGAREFAARIQVTAILASHPERSRPKSSTINPGQAAIKCCGATALKQEIS